ncbi:MAG: transketolase [Alphaproteobacteria bacterium]|nr:transketolase [Alphaproteobacteria bacterium]
MSASPLPAASPDAAPIPLSTKQTQEHRDLANAIRALAMDAVEQAKSGHPGMPMGMADVATVLFERFLKFDPSDPSWPDRDRFVLSAGHGSMLLYALLYLTGYPEMTLDELKRFRQLGSKTAGHPEYGHAPGIETTTGPLGQGLANAVGMALAERLLAAEFGNGAVDHYTYVIAGDGCLMEGISHEAVSLAGHLKLNKLIVLFDDNHITIDGSTDLSVSDDQLQRFTASGWNATAIDGHDPEAIATAIAAARQADKPTLIACRTTIAYGAPTKAGTAASHGAPLGAPEIAGTRQRLGWAPGPFEVPEAILGRWRAIGRKGAAARGAWQRRLSSLPAEQKAEFRRRMDSKLPKHWLGASTAYKIKLAEDKPNIATRVASQNALEVLTAALPELTGGSADLTGSNNTKAKAKAPVKPGSFAGRYIYYGVREHGMAAAMNGMALHRGVIPYGGTFLVFTDYCRPSIRLAALMGLRVVYVMTHDSIGLGEDGPTHQPVEHLAALRCIPNLQVMRPADATETLECWEAALLREDGPTLLALTRQNLAAFRTAPTPDNLCQKGGYVVVEAAGERQVTLIGTGSEIGVALKARELLAAEGVRAAVVSMPCTSLFDRQTGKYRREVLGGARLPRVVVEAGVRQGWEPYLGANGAFVGMSGFGASAPAGDLFKHFGITPEAVAAAAKKLL